MISQDLVFRRCNKTSPPSPQFHSIQEWHDAFLALWPHRFDYIYAEHPGPGQKAHWQTESRHLLSDRLIRQGSHLYGVRFGPTTNYGLLDIDINSFYHPRRDPYAISRILAALEPLGLVQAVTCTSSYSGGLHLYFPFENTQNTWDLAACISTLLQNAGFKLAAGQLEVFPNAKGYSPSGQISLYAAHRLPMQAGSYLVDKNWQVIFSDQSTFVQYWRFAQKKNDLNRQTLQQVLKQARRKQYRISGKADKFLNDLNGEIESGWTGSGQTNQILGKIATRSYVFGHILSGSQPLKGQDLVKDIIRTATALPGYQDYCNHQHEIEKRAQEWARCIETSHYFHYGTQKGKYKAKGEKQSEAERDPKPWDDMGWNSFQREGARERIRRAIADLLNLGQLPAGISQRADALLAYGLRRETLYKHKDLWHPDYLWKTPPDPPSTEKHFAGEQYEGCSPAENTTNFLYKTGVTNAPGKGFSDFVTSGSSPTGVTNAPGKGFSDFQTESDPPQEVTTEPIALERWPNINQIRTQLLLNQEKARREREARLEANREANRIAHAERMKQYLESGEPILIQEALQWFAKNCDLSDPQSCI